MSPLEGRMRRPRPLTERETLALRRLLGRRVREARSRLGLSRPELARAVGRSSGWLGEVERGERAAPAELLAALARARGVAPGWFYRPGSAG